MYVENIDEVQFIRIQSLMTAGLVDCMCVWLGLGFGFGIWYGRMVVVLIVIAVVAAIVEGWRPEESRV